MRNWPLLNIAHVSIGLQGPICGPSVSTGGVLLSAANETPMTYAMVDLGKLESL